MSTVIDILTTSGILALVVLGLWFVLGLLDIINLATTGFMAVGVYMAVVVQNVWLGVLLGIVISAIVGFVVEIGVVRRLYNRPIDAIIATWGISIVLVQLIALVFGTSPQRLDDPLHGAAFFGYPAYRLVLLGISIVLLVAAGLLLRLTRTGLRIRMVMLNEPLASGSGVNTARVRTVTFTGGAALAGAAGAVIGPLQSIGPQYGQIFLVTAFLAVLMSGRSLFGLVIACLIIGIITTVFNTFAPDPIYGTAVVIAAGAIALRFFPEGLVWKRRK